MKKLLHTCILMTALFIGFAANLSAQTLSGIVTEENKTPIIGVTVIVQGTNNGTTTDMSGAYALKNLKKGDVIEFSYVGMQTQSATYTGATKLDVVMKSDNMQIENVVVVGFGSQKKVNLTGSVAVVDDEALSSRPVSSVADMLQGVVPGLNITSSSGLGMDDSPSINVRGTGTIGTGSTGAPLILIDGMEGDFNALNPQDIESISVLKDAASSSIYGSRAPFGVILITTKKGKKGRFSVNYNNNFRIKTPRNIPDVMDSYSFVNFVNDASINSGKTAWFDEDRIQAVKDFQNGIIPDGYYSNGQCVDPGDNNFWGEGYTYGIGDENHYDVAFQDHAIGHEHNMSVQGGTEKVNFYMSANYGTEEGFLKINTEHMNRLTTTAKINAKVYSWLDVNVTTRFTDRNYYYPTNLKRQKYAWSNNMPNFYSSLGSFPIAASYDPNGNLYASTAREVGNPIFSLQGGDSQSDSKYYYQQFQVVIEPIKNWKTFVDYNYRFVSSESTSQLKNTYNVGVDNKTLYPVCIDSYVDEYRNSGDYYNFNAYSEYSTTINELHSIKTMIGFQTENNNSGNVSLKRDGLMVDDLISINTTNGLDINGNAISPTVSGAYSDWATAGFFGRLNYNYDEKYLLEASLRYDGSSRFVGDARWGLFPSGSVGWNVAREDFFEPLADEIGTFKLRASYGQLGNQNTNSLYPTYRMMSIKTSGGSYLINGLKPTVTSEPGLIDPNLTWERIVNWNVGLDVSALENRLNFTADYFVRQTKDMVGPAQELPSIFGIAVPKQNNTDLSTKGYEVSLTWRDRLESGFSYGASVSLSDSKTVIDKYPNPNGLLTTYIAGHEVGEIWGYETIGIAKTDEEMQNHLATTNQDALGGSWAAGDIMYRDQNGDGKINKGANNINNHGDLVLLGNNSPHYAYSFSVDASYKGFDFRAFFQGVMERDMWLGGTANYQGGEVFWGAYKGLWSSLAYENHLDYFRPDADDPLGQNLDSYYPRPLFEGNKLKNQQVQSRYLSDASYLRMKNIQIGYTLPREFIKKAGISNCRIFVSAENMLTFCDLPISYDPETLSGGYFGSAYPLAKTVSMGLNITF